MNNATACAYFATFRAEQLVADLVRGAGGAAPFRPVSVLRKVIDSKFRTAPFVRQRHMGTRTWPLAHTPITAAAREPRNDYWCVYNLYKHKGNLCRTEGIHDASSAALAFVFFTDAVVVGAALHLRPPSLSVLSPFTPRIQYHVLHIAHPDY